MPGLRVAHEVVEQEDGVLAQRRISLLGEETQVAGVGVVAPQMQREPRCTHGPDAAAECIDRTGVAPDVGVVMDDGSVRAVDLLRA